MTCDERYVFREPSPLSSHPHGLQPRALAAPLCPGVQHPLPQHPRHRQQRPPPHPPPPLPRRPPRRRPRRRPRPPAPEASPPGHLSLPRQLRVRPPFPLSANTRSMFPCAGVPPPAPRISSRNRTRTTPPHSMSPRPPPPPPPCPSKNGASPSAALPTHSTPNSPSRPAPRPFLPS
jgi:hypothetical protein